MIAAAKAAAPDIDWAGLSPLIAVLGGALIVLMLGLLRSRDVRETVVPALSIASLAIAIGLSIWQWGERSDLISGALRLDELTLSLTILFCVAGHRDRRCCPGATSPRARPPTASTTRCC